MFIQLPPGVPLSQNTHSQYNSMFFFTDYYYIHLSYRRRERDFAVRIPEEAQCGHIGSILPIQ